ncbi:hypothetical protein [Bacillus sp. JCM 19041]|uniref:hypothetical protein n=1 Tax=Bacillus sp. JCM 19041 TaxID=1460637 RepID=UPI0006D1F8B6
MAWAEYEWEDVAFFFIRDEAVKYLKYQSHNLTKRRVYTHGLGYVNHGDMSYFRALLMTLGN